MLIKSETLSTLPADPAPPEVLFDDVRFADTFLYVLDKQKRRRRLRFNSAQLDYLKRRTSRDLILKARQLGMSTAIQARLFRRVTTSPAATLTLAHEQASTDKLKRIADRFYRNLPDAFQPTRSTSNNEIVTYADFDSEAVFATAGNSNTGRGGTYTDIHGSEFAFWPDAEAVLASIMQGGDPAVVLESTPNGAQGHFYRLCIDALDGSEAWRLFFYPWWYESAYTLPAHPDLKLTLTDDEAALVERYTLAPGQVLWRRSKQRELRHLFAQEFPEDPHTCFLRSGLGYFGDLSAIFTAPADPAPDASHRYVAGLDFGQSNDYTTLSIIDASARVQVARLRINGLPWRDMRQQVIALCKRWHVGLLLAEANSMGSANIESMTAEMESAGCKTSLQAFDTTNASKQAIMGGLYEALHEGGLKLHDDPIQRHELNAIRATQLPSGSWRLAAPDGEHDDTVIALALSWEAVSNGRQTGGIYV